MGDTPTIMCIFSYDVTSYDAMSSGKVLEPTTPTQLQYLKIKHIPLLMTHLMCLSQLTPEELSEFKHIYTDQLYVLNPLYIGK